MDNDYVYHNAAYKDLLETVVPLRSAFRLEKDVQARKEMAKVEFDAWNSYLEVRKYDITQLKTLKEEFEADIELNEEHHESHRHYNHVIPEPELTKLREFFDRSKVSCNSPIIL
jgi:hypothetical protein